MLQISRDSVPEKGAKLRYVCRIFIITCTELKIDVAKYNMGNCLITSKYYSANIYFLS